MGRLLDEDIVIDVIDNLDYMPSEWVDRGLSLCKDAIKSIPSAQPERKISNKEWIDFLVFQFDISRTSAKEMLHGMMQWKKEDNFKKQFRGKQDG